MNIPKDHILDVKKVSYKKQTDTCLVNHKYFKVIVTSYGDIIFTNFINREDAY